MKQLKYLFLALVLPAFASCDQNISPKTSLKGTWSWVSSSGGFAGTIETPATQSEERSIEFLNSRVKKMVDGAVVENLKYSIKLDNSIYSSEKTEIIKYSNGWKQSYSIVEDTLYLNDECYDCYQSIYIRN